MNDKMIYNAFDRMQPSYTDLTENIMCHIKTNKKRAPVRYRVLKTSVCIILAACVLLLSVSGYAAVKLLSVSLPEPGDNANIQYTVNYNAGVVKLSDEVISDLQKYSAWSDENKYKAAYDFGRKFKNYSEVDEYLGLPILKNELFGEAPDNVTPKDIILVSYGDQEKIHYLSVYGTHKIPGASESCFFTAYMALNETGCSQLVILNNANHSVDENGNPVFDFNRQPEGKGASKVLSYTSAQNGIEAEIVVTTETLKNKLYGDIKQTYTMHTIRAYFIHDDIVYNLIFTLNVYEKYESDQVTVGYSAPDPLTADDYVKLMQNVIDAFIVN